MALYQAHCLAVIGERKRVEIAIDRLCLRKDSVRVLGVVRKPVQRWHMLNG